MAKTYYDYKAPDESKQIDWSKVGKDITTELETQEATRVENTKKINEANKEEFNKINSIPKSNDEQNNAWNATIAQELTTQFLENVRGLKNGKRGVKEYTTIHQNLIDFTKDVTTLAQQYKDTYNANLEKFNSGKASMAQAKWLAKTEDFYNFNENKVTIDPKTGLGYFTKMIADKNGNKIPDPNINSRLSTNDVRQILTLDLSKYDPVSDMTKEVAAKGTIVTETLSKLKLSNYVGLLETLTNQGRMTSLDGDDKMALEAYKKWENGVLERKLADPKLVSSMLSDHTLVAPNGEPYDVTFDPNLAKKENNYILFTKKNGIIMPDFSSPEGKKQQELVKEALREQLRASLKESEKLTAVDKQIPTPQHIPTPKADGEKKKIVAVTGSGTNVQMVNGKQTKKTTKSAIVEYKKDNGEPIEPLIFQDPEGKLEVMSDATPEEKKAFEDRKYKKRGGDITFTTPKAQIEPVYDRKRGKNYNVNYLTGKMQIENPAYNTNSNSPEYLYVPVRIINKGNARLSLKAVTNFSEEELQQQEANAYNETFGAQKEQQQTSSPTTKTPKISLK